MRERMPEDLDLDIARRVRAARRIDDLEINRRLDTASRLRTAEDGSIPPSPESDIPPTEEDFEEIMIETNIGLRPTKVPKTAEEKRALLRKALAAMEATKSQNGGPGIESLIRRADTMVSALINDDYIKMLQALPEGDYRKNNDVLGIELLHEFQARSLFHQVYLAFDTAGDVETVEKAVRNFTAPVLNTLFNIEEFTEALGYYTTNWPDEKDKNLDKFRDKVKFYLQSYFISKGQSIESATFNSAWSQNLAERFWEVAGGRADQDEIKVENKNGETEYSFKDSEQAGGNFMLRRILKWKEWLETQRLPNRSIDSLVKDTDIEQKNYFQIIAEKLKKNFEDSKDTVGAAEVDEQIKSKKYSFIKMKDTSGKSIWKSFDFKSINGDYPMSYWAYRNLSQPEGVRAAMTKDSNSYLYNPNQKTLEPLADVFKYMADKQWVEKTKLVKNFIDFAKNEIDKTGKKKYNYTELKALINDLTGLVDNDKPSFIHLQERETLLDHLGDKSNIAEKTSNNLIVKGLGAYLTGALLGFLSWFWKSITSNK